MRIPMREPGAIVDVEKGLDFNGLILRTGYEKTTVPMTMFLPWYEAKALVDEMTRLIDFHTMLD